MRILVVGSIALDSVETPFGKVEDTLGGSATYFSAGASFLAPVVLVAVVGEDFLPEYRSFLASRCADLRGLITRPGQTFRWAGRYSTDLNERETLKTCLNVFADFDPVLPEDYTRMEIVFLANIDPDLQERVLRQVQKPELVAVDTMNYWIQEKPGSVRRVLGRANMAVINEGEARMLSGDYNIRKAARIIQKMGPERVIIKKGEHGALLADGDSLFWAPAFPLEEVQDPTGAGDTFAGGLLGYLSRRGRLHSGDLRVAMVMGSVMASFCVERFGIERFKGLTMEEIEERFRLFRDLTYYQPDK